MHNYYDILHINSDADKVSIKKAYIKQIKIYTPEKNPEKFRRIRNAYETLSDARKRMDYDKYFNVPDEYRDELLAANELIKCSNNTEAINLLTALDKVHPNRVDVQKLLGQAYIHHGKFGKAVKLFEKLYSIYPEDLEVALCLADGYFQRGYRLKAEQQYERVIELDQEKEDSWMQYLVFCKSQSIYCMLSIFERAMSINPAMFSDNLGIYLSVSACYYSEEQTEKSLQYINQFFEMFKDLDKPDEDLFESAIDVAVNISQVPCYHDLIFKLLPVLEKTSHRRTVYAEQLKIIHSNMEISVFLKDEEIHNTIKDLIILLRKSKMNQEDKLDLFYMEYYMSNLLSEFKQPLRRLKINYPDLFDLNRQFFMDLLNPKKHNQILDKYSKECRRLIKKYPRYFFGEDTIDEFDWDENEFVERVQEVETYVRQGAKIGRNDPCSCGSGRKYKHCCGGNG